MVDEVVAHRGAFGGAERVDATHVAQQPLAEVVEVVPFDLVTLGRARGVAPAPADGDRRVEEIRDLVMRHLIVRGRADPDADRTREDHPAITDDIVMNPIMARVVLRLGLVVQRAHLHAAGAEVADEAFLDGHLATPLAEREAVAADMGELTAGERDLPGVFERDDAVHCADRRLIRHGGREGGQAFSMAKGEPTEGEVRDGGVRLAGEGQEFFRDGVGGVGCFHGLTLTGQIGQLAGAAEEPLARLVEQRQQVLDDHAREVVEGRIRLLGRSADLEGAVCRIGGFDAATRGIPLMVERHHRVLGFRRADFAEGREFLGVDADDLLGEPRSRRAARDGSFALDAADIVVPGIIRARSRCAGVGDPELFEGLGPRGNLQRPASVFARREWRQFLAPGDHDLGARRRLVADGLSFAAGIFRVKRDGGGQAIGAFGEDHVDRLGQRAG